MVERKYYFFIFNIKKIYNEAQHSACFICCIDALYWEFEVWYNFTAYPQLIERFLSLALHILWLDILVLAPAWCTWHLSTLHGISRLSDQAEIYANPREGFACQDHWKQNHQSVSSASLPMTLLIFNITMLMQIMKSIMPRTQPGGTPLVRGAHSDLNTLITNLLAVAQPISDRVYLTVNTWML